MAGGRAGVDGAAGASSRLGKCLSLSPPWGNEVKEWCGGENHRLSAIYVPDTVLGMPRRYFQSRIRTDKVASHLQKRKLSHSEFMYYNLLKVIQSIEGSFYKWSLV